MRAPLLLSLLLASCFARGQTAVAPGSEPHYHSLLDNHQVRVFGLTLHRDESAFVRFRHSFMTVALQDGEIIQWDEGKSPIQHFQVRKGETSFRWFTPGERDQGLAGGYKNDRPNDYRNITIEFLDPNIGWAVQNGGTVNPPDSLYLGGALVADISLQPKESFPAPEKRGPELVIPVSDIDLSAGATRIRKSAGEIAWIPPDLASALTNHGKDAARFILVEFQPDTAAPPAER